MQSVRKSRGHWHPASMGREKMVDSSVEKSITKRKNMIRQPQNKVPCCHTDTNLIKNLSFNEVQSIVFCEFVDDFDVLKAFSVDK